jgi:uncharacterized membrane protein YkoI
MYKILNEKAILFLIILFLSFITVFNYNLLIVNAQENAEEESPDSRLPSLFDTVERPAPEEIQKNLLNECKISLIEAIKIAEKKASGEAASAIMGTATEAGRLTNKPIFSISVLKKPASLVDVIISGKSKKVLNVEPSKPQESTITILNPKPEETSRILLDASKISLIKAVETAQREANGEACRAMLQPMQGIQEKTLLVYVKPVFLVTVLKKEPLSLVDVVINATTGEVLDIKKTPEPTLPGLDNVASPQLTPQQFP